MQAYRLRGYEVMVLSGFADNVTSAEARTRLETDLQKLPEAVAVMEAHQGGLQARPAVFDEITKFLQSSGHGLVLFPKALNTGNEITKKIVRIAMDYQKADGKNQNSRQIRKILDQATLK